MGVVIRSRTMSSESGTGWPGMWRGVPESVHVNSIFRLYVRTDVGHLLLA